MSTEEYHIARSEIKTLVHGSLKNTMVQRSGVNPLPVDFDNSLGEKSEQLLNKFESIINKRRFGPFWFGVWQSTVGSILVFLILGLIALVLYGFTQNPFRMLVESNNQRTQTQSTSDTGQGLKK